jgi:hypothetical protein
MAALAGKALFRVARALRLTSYVIGALTAVGLIASPFIASSFVEWLALAGITVGVAVMAYLMLYRGLPRVLARWATTVLPEDQKDYARAELAIWAYEDRHGAARADLRREFHEKLDHAEDVP